MFSTFNITKLFILSCFIFAAKSYSTIVINEFMASNTAVLQDEAGDYDDWLELYNAGGQPIDLSGWFLSDEKTDRKKWTFPAATELQPGEFLLVWCDEERDEGRFHANFKLSKSGEWLGLSRSDLSIEDSLTFTEQITNYSYGRTPDGGDRFILINVPSPEYPNPANVLGIAEPPRLSPAGGVYASPQRIELHSDYPDVLILYTLDGSVPDITDFGKNTFEYADGIYLDTTAVIRTRLYAKDYLPSPVVTAAFFINSPHQLPILSFITDPDNLFDENIGIYSNWDHSGSEWERDVYVSYFKDQNFAFQIPAGLRIQGNSSRKYDKKSFRLYFRDSYGANELNYPFFDLTDIRSFKNIITRAGYDDDLQISTGTLLRDPLGSELYRRLGYPVSHSTLGVLYLNDEFWGIYDFRESVNEYFIRDYYGYEEVDVIRMRSGSWELDYGDAVEWERFLDFVHQNSFESQEMYDQLAARLDVENFTTLLVHQHATQFRSWTYGSFFLRQRKPGAKWQITVWDMDRALTDVNWNGFYFYENNVREYWINIITKRLMENAGYRRYFVNRLSDLFNTTFLPENAITVLDSLAGTIEPAIPFEVAKWGSSAEKWYRNIRAMRDFVTDRPAIVRQHLQDYFGFGEPVSIGLDADTSAGHIKLNTIDLESFPWQGLYYPENKISVTAVPKTGFQFMGWSDDGLQQTPTIEMTPEEGMLLHAMFAPVEETIVINEIKYAHSREWSCGDWIELYNPGESMIRLDGWRLSDDDANHIYTFGSNVRIDPKGFLVVCENVSDFKSCYADIPNIVGNTQFGWDGQDKVRLFNSTGAPVDYVAYGSRAPWDEKASEGEASLALLNAELDNAHPASWKAERAFGSPGRENFTTTTIESDVKESIPNSFELMQNFPNPFNNSTRISFQIPQETLVSLSVFDLRGRLVATLVEKKLAAGRHVVDWDAGDLSSGLYFYQIKTADFKQTKRMILYK